MFGTAVTGAWVLAPILGLAGLAWGATKLGIPVDRDRAFWFVVTGDSGLS